MTSLIIPQGLNFDGTDDYVDCGEFLTQSYTKEAWIKLERANNQNNIISGNSGHAFWVPNESGRKYNVSAGHNHNWYQVEDPNPIKQGWQHYAVTYDASSATMTLFQNGVCIHENSNVPNQSDTSVFLGRYSTNYNFKGTMCEVRIWDHARTQAEIELNWLTELTGNEPGLLAYYKFDQANAGPNNIILHDHSPNTNNGTLKNFSLTGNTSNWMPEVWVGFEGDALCTATNPCGYFEFGYLATAAGTTLQPFTQGTYSPSTGEQWTSWVKEETTSGGESVEVLSLTLNTTDASVVVDAGGDPLEPGQLLVSMNKSTDHVIVQFTAPSDGDYVYRCEWKSITPGYTSGEIMIGAAIIGTTSIGGYGRTPLIEGNILGVKGGITHLKKDDKIRFRVGCHDASKLQLVALDIDVQSFSLGTATVGSTSTETTSST